MTVKMEERSSSQVDANGLARWCPDHLQTAHVQVICAMAATVDRQFSNLFKMVQNGKREWVDDPGKNSLPLRQDLFGSEDKKGKRGPSSPRELE